MLSIQMAGKAVDLPISSLLWLAKWVAKQALKIHGLKAFFEAEYYYYLAAATYRDSPKHLTETNLPILPRPNHSSNAPGLIRPSWELPRGNLEKNGRCIYWNVSVVIRGAGPIRVGTTEPKLTPKKFLIFVFFFFNKKNRRVPYFFVPFIFSCSVLKGTQYRIWERF